MGILETRNYFKPFEYPWAYDYYKKHEAMHWLPGEVEMRQDIQDWNKNLTPSEKHLLTQLFRFFTQADVDVASGYRKEFGPALGGHPEIAMMMSSFQNREAVHIDAYSLLIETVGMPEDTYKTFTEYQEMKDKHEFMFSQGNSLGITSVLSKLAVFSAFGEGMQLFSSFAILMNFERFNKMKGMCNIVRWSIRDESLHVEGMTQLFRELHKETSLEFNELDLRATIRHSAKEMVYLEDKFIDLCFSQGGIQGLTSEDLKKYIRFISNKRWTQLGFSGNLFEDSLENPLEWLDWVVNGEEHTNFFEARSTDYSKGTLQGNTEDIQWK